MQQATVSKQVVRPAGFRQDETIAAFPHTKQINITPELASEWLKSNKNNRPQNKANVRFLVSQMKRKKWMLNGESISFDWDGNLLNGQHRLLAVIESGVNIPSMVTIGLNPKAFSSMDIGRKRTASDLVALKGYKNSKALSGCAYFVAATNKVGLQRTATRQVNKKVDNADVLRFIESSKPFVDHITDAYDQYKKSDKLIPFRTLGSLWWLCSLKNDKKADEFFQALMQGVNLGANHPVFMLRTILIKNKMAQNTRMPIEIQIAYIVKAWNYFVTEVTPDNLRFRKQSEKFPKIK